MDQRDRGARVAIVIPTTGRPSVHEAVRSAVRQDGVSVEVVVVCDATRVPPAVAGMADGTVRVRRRSRSPLPGR